ncbi:MAG: Spo0E family sporulation regulatory protein-aspartic acid phosphatase [Clostridium argentinense]|uniref:Spo0E family sporulation regulatory protein-aspartic acid phosphatase n=1 Tax=Clostridium faecium TaxID=2762223 RepID=A0ABR8YQX1_9CLOT|nr:MULTISPECIES: aspartyl-phosphate phosphatase Spo0E family protein [Clostridium]MBD8046626.1 Spo0E family sporulation regulatory protein-aspartic acid phosphatase [Clostridium faecium]MBS5825164.1 Spo0E family sporulation regulatory protein-aspartic acid phosphatase [Clostridium argentinense]MDU1348707.1 aspartyl-phosphate phosphatase Spo0E family protein [Clostridium argentinense]
MFVKSKILKQKINSFKTLLHLLLIFKKPTDKIVVSCSQHLDGYIVEYQKLKKFGA